MSLSDSTRKIIENVNRAILYSNYKKNFEDYNISEPIKFKGELLITIQKSSLKSVH